MDRPQLRLGAICIYELNQMSQRFRVAITGYLGDSSTKLNSIHLFIPEPNLSRLETHMPQSGFEYVDAMMLNNGKLVKCEMKYRGDTFYRWAWDKKSMRIKTTRDNLFEGMRHINLLAARSPEQLNNYLSYRLASKMGLTAPRTELVRVFVNGKDRGVHFLVEQLKETTIRQSGSMPGDLYRGEIVGKDHYTDGRVRSLFETPAVWDKIAINNHYGEDANAPLDRLIRLIQDPRLLESQADLSEILDLQIWGRFSAYESLTQTGHTDEVHNWRLYYDPWRQKFVPVVWDTMGWFGRLRKGEFQNEVIRNSLMHALFQNGEFVRARSNALRSFFATGQDREFLQIASDAITIMAQEIETDPYLLPADPVGVKHEMYRLKEVIREVFEERDAFLENDPQLDIAFVSAHTRDHDLDLAVRGKHPIQRIRLKLSGATTTPPQTIATYHTVTGKHSVNITGLTHLLSDQLIIGGGFLSDLVIEPESSEQSQRRGRLVSGLGFYHIALMGLNRGVKILSAEFDRGDGWLPVEPDVDLEPTIFRSLYAPVVSIPRSDPVIWSDTVFLSGYQTIKNDLIIQPGTTICLAPDATLVLKGHLKAEGTSILPIRFQSQQANQTAWGAVVLMGGGANGSALSHCEMVNGSGYKDDLREYSGMFSIHDVQDVTITDCLFKDNHIVDDMVHTVYADIEFIRCQFISAQSDALDIDISDALIVNCLFEGSGNDGVDLMSSNVRIIDSTMKNNGDKGISVGEGTNLFAAQNIISGNVIGVESKDRSVALLFNHEFVNNKKALNAYKKNWQYGDGGYIFLSKSKLLKNESDATAEKYSEIHIFDSFVEEEKSGKRVAYYKVDTSMEDLAIEKDWLPEPLLSRESVTEVLSHVLPEEIGRISSSVRGVVSDD